jgi:hypothetical protein
VLFRGETDVIWLFYKAGPAVPAWTGVYEVPYPSIIQAADGAVYVVYTYQRKQIRHLTLDPDGLIAA